MRMLIHPCSHYRIEAFLQEFPGVRIMLDQGTMENLQTILFVIWPTSTIVVDLCHSTTLLVSPRTESLDLLSLDEPEDEILEQPEQHLPMHGRQRASCDAGGKKPLREAEAPVSDTPSGNCKPA